VGFPFILVGGIGLLTIPSIVSWNSSCDLGLNWGEFNKLFLLLGKSWVESGMSSLLVGNPVEVIGSGDVGLL
jgi:hypothetical protein